MNRKEFLKLSGMVFLSSLLPFGLSGWAAGVADNFQGDLKNRKRMIVLFQRGAVDGLSLVIPFNDAVYSMRVPQFQYQIQEAIWDPFN